MERFAIHVDTTSSRFIEEVRTGGNIFCNFYILVNEWAYPSNTWQDFPVIVLTWWIEGYLKLCRAGTPVVNSFMNGPFEFVSTIEKENVILTFRQRTITGVIEMGSPSVLRLYEYKSGLIEAAEQLLKAMEGHAASGQDLDNLKGIFNSL